MAPSSPLPPPCAGVVLLRPGRRGTECLLVRTPAGQWGFPKGKRERGEDVLTNALRELMEETGLRAEHLTLTEGFTADERSDRGNLAVRYLAGTANEHAPAPRAAPEEHDAVSWVPIDEARARLRPSRRLVLEAALEAVDVHGASGARSTAEHTKGE